MKARNLTTPLSFLLLLLGAPFALASGQASPSPSSQDLTPHSDIALVAESAALRPGSTTTVAFRITMDAGWHTYWTNPGDAGLPLTVQWQLPDGISASGLRFPIPHVLPQPPLMSYGYENRVLVLADLSVAPTVPTGRAINVSADVEFLVCAEVCLPASGHVELKTRTAGQVGPSRWAGEIATTRAALAQDARTWPVTAWRAQDRIVVMTQAPETARAALRAAYLVPDSTDVLDHSAAQLVAMSGDTVVLSMVKARHFPDSATRFSGVLLDDVQSPKTGYRIETTLLATAPRSATQLMAMLEGPDAQSTGGAGMAVAPAAIAAPASVPDIGFLLALVLAFVGGVILNLMPCVFPVLSVKILAFVERGGRDDNGVIGRRHAIVFTLGVLVTFWALAAALLALRAGGAQLGWGFQLQSPGVVAVLALLVFALALNLSGVYTMGMSLTRLGAVGSGERYTDSFVTGLLAVVVATPCTAPFMGAALGYALTQHAAIGMAVFTALGLGLAAPYILFASSPRLLRKLPRPGPWLETLKQLLAFPLYATVVWLLWVLGRQAGTDHVALTLLFVVAVSLAAWLTGRAQFGGRTVASAASLVAVLALIVGGGVVIASRPPAPMSAAPTPAGWEPWSAARVAEAQAAGQPVFVDFTAAWCLSCQVNERVALRTTAVERAFADANVVLLRADWTSRDEQITSVLATFGRSGVPLYVMYPANGVAAAEILPAVLTPGVVLDAVARATAGRLANGD